MAVKHGIIGEYDGRSEDWESYAERLEQYFVGNDVTAPAKKRAILLSICGAETVHALTQKRGYPNEASSSKLKGECYSCGGKHRADTCRFRDTECFVCGRQGHLARMCRDSRRREGSRANRGTQEHWLADRRGLPAVEDEPPEEYSMY